jgi:hypothetical protein
VTPLQFVSQNEWNCVIRKLIDHPRAPPQYHPALSLEYMDLLVVRHPEYKYFLEQMNNFSYDKGLIVN